MKTYNILVQFPNHHFQGPVTVQDGWEISNKHEIITTFTFDGLTVYEDGSNIALEERELLSIFAEFFDFGAKYFKNGELNGDDVAAKLRLQLGELYLGNQPKSTYSYRFTGVWPHSVNFGELCYSSDPTVHLEVTWKYKEMTTL
jgi:hypothetical protein